MRGDQLALEAEVAVLRQQLDEARRQRDELDAALIREHEIEKRHLGRAVDAEADRDRLLVVYRAAEALAAADFVDRHREFLALREALAAWTPAKVGDTPGELVPGEGERVVPVWGTDVRSGTPEPNWDLPYLDFPTAWWIQEQGFGHTDERCSAVQSNGAVLCDCGAVEADWKRLRAEKRPVDTEDGDR